MYMYSALSKKIVFGKYIGLANKGYTVNSGQVKPIQLNTVRLRKYPISRSQPR